MSKVRNTDEQYVSAGRIIAGSAVGAVVTLILTFGGAVAVSRELVSLDFCRWAGAVIVGLSAFFSAWVAARRNCKKLLSGVLSGLLYGAVLVIAGALLFSSPMAPGRLVLSLGVLLVGSVAGVFCAGLTE